MNAWTVFFIIGFLLLLGIQFLTDALFAFICFITGTALLKSLFFFNTKFNFLPYSAFKLIYKTDSAYKRPIFIGLLIWIIIFAIAINFF